MMRSLAMLYDDYDNDVDPANILTFGTAHVAIMECLWAILRGSFSYSEQDQRFDERVHRYREFLDPYSNKCYLEYAPEYGDNYLISAIWRFDFICKDEYINGVAEFSQGQKYLVLADSLDWNFYDETSQYDFPAVFYSPIEIQMWFLWALKKKMHFQPRLKPFFTQVINELLNEKELTAMFKSKLNGDIPWEHSPARVHEPNVELWHQRTRDEKMNQWILQWLD